MQNTFTNDLRTTASCKNCGAEVPKRALVCDACGVKSTHPEFLAALIVLGLGIMAMYALFKF